MANTDQNRASEPLAKRRPCYADLTLRDDQHIFALCRKPKDHTDAHHDDELGVTWTDEHHA